MTAPDQPRAAQPLSGRSVIVLGAGMVGVSCALELQSRGAEVLLIDRSEPGRETSYGNAGVMTRSSLAPLNAPSLWRDLPRLLGNKSASLRYDPAHVAAQAGWAARFLAAARPGVLRETAEALDALIRLSIARHKEWIAACGVSGRLREHGWIVAYRTADAFDRAGWSRALMAEHGVDLQTLDQGALGDLEPALRPIFPRATWVRDACSVDDPGAIVAAYAGAFAARGGRIERASVARFAAEAGGGGAVVLEGGATRRADHVVACLGPWSATILARCGFGVRLGYERGYHLHFAGAADAGENARLTRPVYDTAGGYVVAPMARGLRVTSGVELADRDAAPNHAQIRASERAARDALDLGDAVDDAPWLGSRPTLPDSRPAIGPLPGAPGLWAAFGHQHIGFMTGPGTAALLADLIQGRAPAIDAGPFRPERWVRRWRVGASAMGERNDV